MASRAFRNIISSSIVSSAFVISFYSQAFRSLVQPFLSSVRPIIRIIEERVAFLYKET